MDISKKIALTRKIIAENTGRFITVDFIKKDGTLRHMTCHKSRLLEQSCTGNNPEATAKRKATIAAGGMLQVEELKADRTYQFRTVNLNTVQRIAANGVVYNFV